MRKYNNVAITKIANPNICRLFGDCDVVTFEPKCKPVTIKNGEAKEFIEFPVKFTINYVGPYDGHNHAIIMFNNVYIAMDITEDVVIFS